MCPHRSNFGERALSLAARFGDNSVRAHALNNIGSATFNVDRPAGIAKLEESLAVSLEHNLQEHAGRAYANLVSQAVSQHLPPTGPGRARPGPGASRRSGFGRAS
jgi:hypothetical protein